jgi:spermidine synthase
LLYSRFFCRGLRDCGMLDLSGGEPFASLFTQEFYQAVAQRLEPRGIFLQWFQGYEVDRQAVLTIYATLTSGTTRAPRGVKPFETCDNTLLLAEALGVGSADLSRIDVRGVPIAQVRYAFR